MKRHVATDDRSEIEIVDLRDRPQMLSAVVEQNFDVWHEFTDIDRSTMHQLFSLDVPRGGLPVHLIALADGRYAGEVSLRSRSMGSVHHPDVYLEGVAPWLSNMWVADWARGKGVATKLTHEIEALAKSLGYARVYSSTEYADSLYHKAGYRDIEQRMHRDRTIYLIAKDI